MGTQRRRLRPLPALLGVALVAGALAAVPAGAAPTWLAPPVTLAQGEFGPVDVQVVVDAAGNATAAWVMDGSTVTIQAATHPVGGTWSSPVIVASGEFDNQLDLAVNAAGTAVAIWSRFTGSATVVDSATKSPGGGWSAPAPVSDGTSDAEDPQVVVDAAGDAVATWLESPGPTQVLRSATRTATGPWSTTDDVSVPDDGSSTDHYDLAITSAGEATAAWEFDDIGDGHMIQSAVRPAGGTFGDPVRISAAGITITGVPSVAVNANGVAIVAWHQDVGTEQVKSATRAATGVWSGVQSVSAAGGWNIDPDVVIDAAGTSTAVWVRNQSMQPGKIKYSTRPAGGTWSAPEDLDTPTVGYESPTLAIDPSGRITAAYVVNNPGGNDSISATTREPGGAWTAPVPLSALPSGTNGLTPDVAMDDAGQAVVAWLGSTGVEELAQVRALDSQGPLPGGVSIPANATAGQPAAFSWVATDAWSAVSSVAWTFGDGSSGSGSSVSKTYAAAGTYAVSVTATDAVGNATTRTGSVVVAPSPAVMPKPSLTGVKLTKTTIHVVKSDEKPRATKLKLTLNTAAKVIVKIKRTQKVKGKTVKAKVTKSRKAGKSAIRLTSRISGMKLPPGKYTVTVTAKNAVGTSVAVVRKLKIVP